MPAWPVTPGPRCGGAIERNGDSDSSGVGVRTRLQDAAPSPRRSRRIGYRRCVRLRSGARVAIVGAGPSGLVAAKHALQAGFDVAVFEASDDLGGQWHTTAPHSGVWPGMHTNTSRAMTAFSDFPAPESHPLHPAAEQIRAYLEAYASAFGVTGRIRLDTRVEDVKPGWTVDGEPFDAVVVASGRFRKPR